MIYIILIYQINRKAPLFGVADDNRRQPTTTIFAIGSLNFLTS